MANTYGSAIYDTDTYGAVGAAGNTYDVATYDSGAYGADASVVTVGYGSGAYGAGPYGGTLVPVSGGSLISVTPANGSVVVAGGRSQLIYFGGSGTTWLTNPPTISVSAGGIGSIIVDSDTMAHMLYLPPVSPQTITVTFTDATDQNTSAALIAAQAATSISLIGPNSDPVNLTSGPFTIGLLPLNSALDVLVTVTPNMTGSGSVSNAVTLQPNLQNTNDTFTVTPTSTGSHTIATTHLPVGGMADATPVVLNATGASGGSLLLVSPLMGTVVVAGSQAQLLNFVGLATAWLTNPPTITATAGTLSTIVIDSNTALHATYTPPALAQTVTFTDTTDQQTTVQLVVAPAATGYSLSGPPNGLVNNPSGFFTVMLTPNNAAIDVPVTVYPVISAPGIASGNVILQPNMPNASGTFSVIPTGIGNHTVSVTHNPP